MHTQFLRAVLQIAENEDTVKAAAAALYECMHDDERLSLLQGDWSLTQYFSKRQLTDNSAVPYPASAVSRVGVPGFHVVDGARGAGIGSSTEFPSPSCRAASFDRNQEEMIGQAIGTEVQAQGGNLYSGVCLNIARHPAWGRSHESYGEDPIVVSSMGTAVAKGVRKHVMVGVRHFALNSMENLREDADIKCDEATMHECFLQHFKDVLVESEAEVVLCAGNSVNGVVCAENPSLLNGLLREKWQLNNVVVASDFTWRLQNGPASVKAGLDIELPCGTGRTSALQRALDYGSMNWSTIQIIAERILASQLRYCARAVKVPVPGIDCVRSTRHIDLARQAVASSMVVLKNDGNLLPINRTSTRNLAVLGATADRTQDHAEEISHVHTPPGITPLEAIQTLSDVEVSYDDGTKISRAVRLAKDSDIVVLFMGPNRSAADKNSKVRQLKNSLDFSTKSWSLKSHYSRLSKTPQNKYVRDRGSIALESCDIELAKAIVEIAGPKTIIVIEAGSSVVIPKVVRQKAGAILFSSYGGRQFANGLKDVLIGAAEPSGRLPFVMPESEQQLPDWNPNGNSVRYDKHWGYRLLQERGERPAYPFGFGLGYGECTLSDLWCPSHLKAASFEVNVKAINISKQATSVVVQIYGRKYDRRRDSARASLHRMSTGASLPRPARRLLGFAKELLQPGETTHISVTCRLSPLAVYDVSSTKLRTIAGDYEISASRCEGEEKSMVMMAKMPQEIEC